MTQHYSVAIVGAGPTGLMLANLLSCAGVSTVLIETNGATVSEPRAVSIDDETLRVVQRIGLLDVVTAEIVSGYGSEYLAPDRSVYLTVKPQTEPYGHPRRNAFRQPVFEAQLRAGVARFAHVATLFECRCESFAEGADRLLLKLRRGDGEALSITADFLIGCDGAWSQTREALGYALAGDSLAERWLIIDLEDSPSASPETIVYCDHRRPAIMLPGPRDTRRYEFKLLAGETDAAVLSDEKVAELLASHGVVPGSRIVRKTVYHFHARIADHWGRGRVWLAGDAAHLMPPFAGQGMNGGIRDAANLAWKLAAVVAGQAGPTLLESYERERRGHVGQMIRLALRMGAVFGPPTALHGWAIRTSFRFLARWPAAKLYFAEMRYKPSPRFEDGFLITAQPTRRGLVGRLLPQPPLRRRRPAPRLDDLLGDGFALVAVDVAADLVEHVPLGRRWTAPCRRVDLSSQEVPEFAPYAGQLLLVRPDRYVMAAFTPEEAPRVALELDRLLKQTWLSTRPSLRPTPRVFSRLNRDNRR